MPSVRQYATALSSNSITLQVTHDRIRRVFTTHISEETLYKESELAILDERILDAKVQLQRIRLVILAEECGQTGVVFPGNTKFEHQSEPTFTPSVSQASTSWVDFEQRLLDTTQESNPSSLKVTPVASTASSQVCSREPSEVGSISAMDDVMDEEGDDFSASRIMSSICSSPSGKDQFDMHINDLDSILFSSMEPHAPVSPTKSPATTDTCISSSNQEQSSIMPPQSSIMPLQSSRFYTKRRVIVGNTSQYLSRNTRSISDASTHKWMVYVRTLPNETGIHTFVKSVRFFLHPSYKPHDLVQVTTPPFQLTRFGWGEFPVRVQLLFHNSRHKPVDIIHNLKLDRTHTGQQMLGAETVVDVELEKDEHNTTLRANSTNSQNSVIPVKPDNLSDDSIVNKATIKIPAKECEATTNLVDDKQSFGIQNRSTLAQEGLGSAHCSRVISLPLSNQNDVVLLDHDYCQTVVVQKESVPVSKPNHDTNIAIFGSSPPFYISPCASVLSSKGFVDNTLHDAVALFPLYTANPNPEYCPFAASSLDHYRSWSMPKQRANEWMRAVAVRKHVYLEAKLRGVTDLKVTTREIVLWCRRNGYTPLNEALVDSLGFCKYCGHQIESTETNSDDALVQNFHLNCEESFGSSGGVSQISTVTPPFEILQNITEVEPLKPVQTNSIVDIESVEPIPAVVPSLPSAIRRQPRTPELCWVQQTAAMIGIQISPLLKNGKVLHVVEHMIFVACVQFLRKLVRGAVHSNLLTSPCSADGDSLKERMIVPYLIYKAILQEPTMDFLTDEGLGFSMLEK